MMRVLPAALLLSVSTIAIAGDEAGDAALATVQAFMDALSARDVDTLNELLVERGDLVRADSDGTLSYLAHADYLESLGTGNGRLYEEIFDTDVRVHGVFASVWAPYNFYLDGTLHHCGVNNFSLVKQAGTWKVAAVAYSATTDGCEPQTAGHE